MVIHYRDKFLKIFGLFILGVILLIVLNTLIRVNLDPNSPDFVNNLILVPKLTWILTPVVIVTYILYFWSHYLLAKAKGYSAWFTLLGLINIFGLIILFLLPDKAKNK